MKKQKKHIISAVQPGSIAQELELQPGDALISVNDQPMEDIFDYRYLMNEEYVVLLVEKADGVLQITSDNKIFSVHIMIPDKENNKLL